MKRTPLSFFGIPTLISILILILVYSLVSVVLVSVEKAHQSLNLSYDFLETSYTLETQADQKTAQLVQSLRETKDPHAWLTSHPEFSLDEINQTVSFTLEASNQRIMVVIALDSNLTRLHQTLEVINTQDYSNNGHAVYGGTP